MFPVLFCVLSYCASGHGPSVFLSTSLCRLLSSYPPVFIFLSLCASTVSFHLSPFFIRVTVSVSLRFICCFPLLFIDFLSSSCPHVPCSLPCSSCLSYTPCYICVFRGAQRNALSCFSLIVPFRFTWKLVVLYYFSPYFCGQIKKLPAYVSFHPNLFLQPFP